MKSDAFEFTAVPRHHSIDHIKPPTAHLLPPGGGVSPVLISTTTFTHRDAVPHETSRRTSTPSPDMVKRQEWAAMRKICTASDNDCTCGRMSPMTATATTDEAKPFAQAHSASVMRPSLHKERLLPAMERLPAAVRQACTPMPPTGATATELSFSDDTRISNSSISLPGSRPSNASSSCDISNSPVKAADVSRKSSGSTLGNDAAQAAAGAQKYRVTMWENGPHTRLTTAHRSATPLPPLPSPAPPKAPSALAPPPSWSSITLSLGRSPSKLSEIPRLPRSVSPLEGCAVMLAPHRPPQRWSGSDDCDDSTATPADGEGLADDGDGGVNAALPVRRRKRVGRGFNRKSRDAESSEFTPNTLFSERAQLVCTGSDLTCNTSSTGLLGGGQTSVMERNRRTSISFNNKVAVADDESFKDDDLHHLCDTPHHQSLAQPYPLALIDADFSLLSSTTIIKRDGVTHII